MNNFKKVINKYRTESYSEADKGNKFERLMQAMLCTVPPYSDDFKEVWLWNEFPFRESISLHDTGIDIICKTYAGDYWAVQCKCYQTKGKISKESVNTFLATSARSFFDNDGEEHNFSFRLWIDTTEDGFTSNASETFTNQQIPASILHLSDLSNMPVDWEKLDNGITGKKAITELKQLRPHQQEALNAAINHYNSSDRGKLIMACGTGKTFTSLRIAETMTNGGKVLFLVPSIALLGQTLREWSFDAQKSIRPICICSDSGVSAIDKKKKNSDDSFSSTKEELAFPASTNVEEIKRQLYAMQNDKREGMLVVFSTYQSIECIANAQKSIGKDLDFDLIICDEAHRTTGVALKGDDESAFMKVHDETFLRAKKRMYMTATPRLYREADQKKAIEEEAYLCSMDDESIYGAEFYRLGFGEAVNKNLLSDYKVIILNVEPEEVSTNVQLALKGIDKESQKEVDTDDVAKLIGCINALSKRSRYDNYLFDEIDPQPMHRAVAFCQNIKMSKAVKDAWNNCGKFYREALNDGEREGLVKVSVEHVDGSMGASLRDKHLNWLKDTATDGVECRILSNVRCLSEGVDVPSLDAVIFLSAKNSQVDVVQSVGRVMRRAEGKKYGYIIIPIVVPSDISPEEALNSNKNYAVVWDILNALRAHDDRFNATVNKIELNKQRPDAIQVIQPGSKIIGQGGGDSDEEHFNSESLASESKPTYGPQLSMRFEELKTALFARMVKKVGNRRYWEQWAADVAKIAERHIAQIKQIIATDEKAQKAFGSFMDGLHADINPTVGEEQAVEMLAQHIITQPVFNALFDNYAFAENNPISKAMNQIVAVLNDTIPEGDRKSLQAFYESVRQRAEGIDNAEAKQRIVIELYDKFFSTAFPKVKEQLGIVYTPVEVVDFIIHSVEHVLNKHFDRSLNDQNIKIIDPFTGTGTFITRLLQSGIIKDIEYKYNHEIFANEIVLLAYYIASVNIENVYHDIAKQTDKYSAFPGICLTDTFQIAEQMYAHKFKLGKQVKKDQTPFAENSERVQRQIDSPITVIIGNPPYSVGQKSANDNAQNQHYEHLERQIQKMYVEGSTATNNNSIYDSYIKAFRYATDRLGDEGIVAFITNSGWLDGNAGAIFRQRIENEYSAIYVINLRGAIRANMKDKEACKREGGNVFDIMTGVAITILVKTKKESNSKKANIQYYSMDDYLTSFEKKEYLSKNNHLGNLVFSTLHPNEHCDWINLRNNIFSNYIPLEPSKKYDTAQNAFFLTNSCGIKTQRDKWCYNYSKSQLENTASDMIVFYNEEREKLAKKEIGEVNYNTAKISWTRAVLGDLKKNKKYTYSSQDIVQATYRPFSKQYLYYYKPLNEMTYQIPKIFPKGLDNLVICMSCTGTSKEISIQITNIIPDLHFVGDTQCFPLYYYEEKQVAQPSLFESENDKYVKCSAISDFILKRANEQYGDNVSREDIFYYVYGFLHCPNYGQTFANDLKKMLPRLPLVEKSEDFWAFSKAGRELAELHLNYESLPPSKDVVVNWSNMLPGLTDTDTPEKLYYVSKMKHPKKGKIEDRTQIIYNEHITLSNIPLRAYDYIVNGKSAIGWIMERYCYNVDKDTGIVNDANLWGIEHGNPKYPLELLQSIITLSIRTLEIVDGLPKISFD